MTGLPRWHRYGEDAVLVEVADPVDRWRLRCDIARETVVGAETVLIRFDPARHSTAEVIAAVDLVDSTTVAPREHLIAVTYDGPDLVATADRAGMSVAALIERHTGATYRAEFCGFAPGFAYLSGLAPALAAPRRANPRPRVPRGSVAIAGPYCAVYPTDSPGGWQLLGHTDERLFDPAAHPPALIAPGDLVRFRALP